jgi:hypothetical protein
VTLPSRSGARAAGAALVVLVAVAPASGWQSSATAQQSGVSVTLSDDRMHRIVARADGAGGLDMTCIQGDEHTAREVLRSMAATTRGGDLPLTGATGRVAVNGTLGIDPDRPAGADAEGRVLLFTPGEVSPGSSFSHFDRRAEPNLLMEPNISSDLPVDGVDLTDDTLRDFGWRGGRFAAEIVVADPAGQGFNDPVRGADRLAALEHVLGIWGDLLGSAAGVTVEASFGELDCGTSGGVLAAAGPRTVIRDFDGGEPGVWYPGPVAESILGVDQTPDGSTDLRATFNAAVDDGCLGGGSSWYYGTDTAPPGTISFVTVALHELGHGLGFLGLTDLDTGELFRGFPDVMTVRAFDNQKNKYWDEFNDPRCEENDEGCRQAARWLAVLRDQRPEESQRHERRQHRRFRAAPAEAGDHGGHRCGRRHGRGFAGRLRDHHQHRRTRGQDRSRGSRAVHLRHEGGERRGRRRGGGPRGQQRRRRHGHDGRGR